MKLDRGFRFPCVTVKKIKIEVKYKFIFYTVGFLMYKGFDSFYLNLRCQLKSRMNS